MGQGAGSRDAKLKRTGAEIPVRTPTSQTPKNLTLDMDDARKRTTPIKGRGATTPIPGRFEVRTVAGEDDGWGSIYEHLDEAESIRTTVTDECAKSIISRNTSPDIGFSQSINPFRGCEHGCVYCFARPTHSYLNLSPGLDFETKLYAKCNSADLLRAELSKAAYQCSPIALGINTDGYQPIERSRGITRQVLEVLAECRHPCSIVTKGALVTRDLDLLALMAGQGLVSVYLSITTLDNRLSANMEPRAAAPHTRLAIVRKLSEAGIPVGVLVAPVVPAITDGELEAILEAARDHGARAASYVLLRLPHELKEIWREWLQLHYPDRVAHVMSLIQQMRGGRDYDGEFGSRMRGQGPFADLIGARFRRAHRRLGYGQLPELDCSRFAPPRPDSRQRELF